MIFSDTKLLGMLDRRLKQSAIDVSLSAGSTLNILVENMGRINFGAKLVDDRKGITESVKLDGKELLGWEMFSLSLDDLTRLRFSRNEIATPAFHRGSFNLNRLGDTFLDMRGWGKGNVWVNGHHLGRFWKIGPQQTLFVPAQWLRRGRNEITVLDLENGGSRVASGAENPIFAN
jgi:beta-galactosidase